jgi:hypothetical protein
MVDVAGSPLRGRMIFIVGSRRSGTNWIQRILSAHAGIANVPSETALFSMGIVPLMERFHHGAIGSYRLASLYVQRDELLGALRTFCDTIFEGVRRSLSPGAERVMERTPDHVLHLDLVGDIYPDAHFVHIIRDGRDVARSLVSQSWGPDSVTEAAAQWRSAIEAARSAAPRLDHYHEVRYEDLMSNTRDVVCGLFDRLGMSRDAGVIDNAVHEAGLLHNVDPADPRIVLDKWRSHFSAADLTDFNRVAGSTLSELGYEDAELIGGAVPMPTSAVPASRSPIDRARRRLAALRRGPMHGSFGRETLDRLHSAQVVFDGFLESIAAGRLDRIELAMSPVARVVIVDRAGGWTGTGPAAVSRLLERFSSDPALEGRQLRGDTWPALPAFSAVLSYEMADGSVEDRALILYIEGNRITRLAYYAFPLGTG